MLWFCRGLARFLRFWWWRENDSLKNLFRLFAFSKNDLQCLSGFEVIDFEVYSLRAEEFAALLLSYFSWLLNTANLMWVTLAAKKRDHKNCSM